MWSIGDVKIAPVEKVPWFSDFLEGANLSERVHIEDCGASAEIWKRDDRLFLEVLAPAVRLVDKQGTHVLVLPKGEYRYWPLKAASEAREQGEQSGN